MLVRVFSDPNSGYSPNRAAFLSIDPGRPRGNQAGETLGDGYAFGRELSNSQVIHLMSSCSK